MDTLTSMRVFACVAELGSFAAAARRNEISPAMVTKHIAALEARVRTALLTRTTRKVALTEAGAQYLQQCQEILRLVAAADEALGHQREQPGGTLRVTAPVELGNAHVAPCVAGLLEDNPGLSIQLDLTNRQVDLTEEGVDVAVRVASQLDSALPGRRIASSRLLPVAAPIYLERMGRPVCPDELLAHQALVFGIGDWSRWPFTRDGQAGVAVVTPRLRSISSEALRLTALSAGGIALLPTFLVGGDLRAGRLVPLLTDWHFGQLGIHLLYPQRRYRPARVQVFVDALLGRLGGDPQADPFWAS